MVIKMVVVVMMMMIDHQPSIFFFSFCLHIFCSNIFLSLSFSFSLMNLE